MALAVVAGHLCVDLIPVISAESAASGSFMAPGRMSETDGLTIAPGGCVSNTGIALFKLGTPVRLVGRLGDDRIGQLTRDVISSIHPSLVADLEVVAGAAGAYTLVISPPNVDRTFLGFLGPNDTFASEHVPDHLLRQADLFHLGYPPLLRTMYADGGAELSRLLQRAKALGATTSLDTAMPDPARPSGKADWEGILQRALPHVDLFMPSVEELLFMLWRERYDTLARAAGHAGMIDALTAGDVRAVAQRTLALGTRMLVIKMGHRGLYLRTRALDGQLGRGAPGSLAAWSHRELWAPCFRVGVAGTVGAGDATIAGFITALLRRLEPEAAMTAAVAVGACNVEAADATSGVRSWEETIKRLRSPWDRLDARLDDDAWAWDETRGLWRGPDDGI
jgi:sugar/nucleoside kinase (ribokinase family)